MPKKGNSSKRWIVMPKSEVGEEEDNKTILTFLM